MAHRLRVREGASGHFAWRGEVGSVTNRVETLRVAVALATGRTAMGTLPLVA